MDASTDEAVYMDYRANLSTTADADGNVQMVTLALPEKIQVFVMLDVFPSYTEEIK